MNTTTTDKPTLPAYEVTKDDLTTVNEAAKGYLAAIAGQKQAEAALVTHREGKFYHMRGIGFRACLDGTTGGKFDRLLALAAFDKLGEAFDIKLTELDRKARQNKGEPLPEARELVKIDGSLRVMKSIVRKAIEAGHNILGNESKAALQEAAGNKSTGGQTMSANGAPNGRGARPPSGAGDEPRNVATGADTLAKLSPKLQAVMTELAAVITATTDSAKQDELASCLIDALAAFRAPAEAPKAEPVKPTAAQVASLKPRSRKAA